MTKLASINLNAVPPSPWTDFRARWRYSKFMAEGDSFSESTRFEAERIWNSMSRDELAIAIRQTGSDRVIPRIDHRTLRVAEAWALIRYDAKPTKAKRKKARN